MTSRTIVPSVLGLQAEQALQHDVAVLERHLATLRDEDWQRTTPVGGATIATVVAHLAEGARRLSHAWRARVDAEANEALLHTFDDPSAPPEVEMATDDAGAVRAAYDDATGELLTTLSGVRQEDWSWPVWSPLGGLETLGEAVRRTLAHHHVHASDVAHGLGMRVDQDDDVTRLVTEFVLDAVARRGGEAVEEPLVVEVITDLPGAATWTLVLGQPAPAHVVESIWEEILGPHRAALPAHRVERGSDPTSRLTLRAGGEAIWRAAFQRGATWDDLHVHGDDDAKKAWDRLLTHATDASGLGRVQH